MTEEEFDNQVRILFIVFCSLFFGCGCYGYHQDRVCHNRITLRHEIGDTKIQESDFDSQSTYN